MTEKTDRLASLTRETERLRHQLMGSMREVLELRWTLEDIRQERDMLTLEIALERNGQD